MVDLLQVVAKDALHKAHELKQEEPTIEDDNNYRSPIKQTAAGGDPDQHKEPASYERIDSPQRQSDMPFQIHLL